MRTSTSDRPLILLDFDDTINVNAPARHRGRMVYQGHGWRERRMMLDGGFPEVVFWNPRIISRLRGLARAHDADLAWGDDAGRDRR